MFTGHVLYVVCRHGNLDAEEQQPAEAAAESESSSESSSSGGDKGDGQTGGGERKAERPVTLPDGLTVAT